MSQQQRRACPAIPAGGGVAPQCRSLKLPRKDVESKHLANVGLKEVGRDKSPREERTASICAMDGKSQIPKNSNGDQNEAGCSFNSRLVARGLHEEDASEATDSSNERGEIVNKHGSGMETTGADANKRGEELQEERVSSSAMADPSSAPAPSTGTTKRHVQDSENGDETNDHKAYGNREDQNLPRRAKSLKTGERVHSSANDSSSYVAPEVGGPAVESGNKAHISTTQQKGCTHQFAPPVLDIETALSVLIPDNQREEKEMLTVSAKHAKQEPNGGGDGTGACPLIPQSWVHFRVGHCGDAAALSSFFGRSSRQQAVQFSGEAGVTSKAQPPDPQSHAKDDAKTEEGSDTAERHDSSDDIYSELELRLSEGFGDEQTPPAFHAILAEVHTECGRKNHFNRCGELHNGDAEQNKRNDTNTRVKPTLEVHKRLGGAAVVSLEWDAWSSSRVLRVDALRVISDHNKDGKDFDAREIDCFGGLLRRRLLLRLSALGLATGCEALQLPPTEEVEDSRCT